MPRRRKDEPEQIDPAGLAAGYMFPERFAAESFALRSQEATERPFAPTAAAQLAMPGLPPVDWEHIRQKQAQARQARKRRQPAPAAPRVFVVEPPTEEQS
ncbi:hypothetical protein SE17_31285 [Kouleothrix aurantiaca]|uniref:Uncharacterized protein n=1 Tax=Kouleothrix aurantiaca TaxID=186479 RepID=A0A0P9D303_9CHLR|nr:hypothetical protein SE17_31285 [Kouleothrix aurantiaca]